MADVRAAKATSRKNSAPTSAPTGKSPNATGKDWKMSDGPAPASKCGLAKTMGKMARPAAKATTVSSTAMVAAVGATATLDGT